MVAQRNSSSDLSTRPSGRESQQRGLGTDAGSTATGTASSQGVCVSALSPLFLI